jgi:hypothetical protein
MNKQELAHIAKVMYDLQEDCKRTYGCFACRAYNGDCAMKKNNKVVPAYWGITKADIERLERESNDA